MSKVWIFGSRARGDEKKFSDLDVLYESKTLLPLSVLSKIKEDIEESKITIKVDIVLLKDLPKTFLPTTLKDRIAV
ncbi:MAG: nucleotidyltransferase domain-containing protein [Xanthomonadaceae bacterium]|nr:nucleotidyltransferase domain-containing protein [Xanthomonadaceae bacterium]